MIAGATRRQPASCSPLRRARLAPVRRRSYVFEVVREYLRNRARGAPAPRRDRPRSPTGARHGASDCQGFLAAGLADASPQTRSSSRGRAESEHALGRSRSQRLGRPVERRSKLHVGRLGRQRLLETSGKRPASLTMPPRCVKYSSRESERHVGPLLPERETCHLRAQAGKSQTKGGANARAGLCERSWADSSSYTSPTVHQEEACRAARGRDSARAV
jgi:hypothetical protein